jgi:sec-independent protein translocase protein TatB
MFNIGGGEFLVIALIALIVLGPQRLPDAARQVGKVMGELRRMSSGFQSELKDALSDNDTSSSATPPRNALARPAEASPEVTDAVSSVSNQPRARRAPLQAAPARRAPIKAAPIRAAPIPTVNGTSATPPAEAPAVPKTPRPRTKGS